MNMPADNDDRRRFRVVGKTEPPKPKSPGAEAARRHRARKRGENVPKRKPGPKPSTVFQLRQEIGDLKASVQRLELAKMLLTRQLQRRNSSLTVERTAEELLVVLARDDPRRDVPERQELLGNVLAAIESRHEHWAR